MNRRGMVLPLVLLALLVVLATAALLLDTALLLQRAGEREIQAVLAKALASGSVGLRASQWDTTAVAPLVSGGGIELGTRIIGRRLRGVDSVVRLGPTLFLLMSSARGGGPEGSGVERRVTQLIQVDSTGAADLLPGGWSLFGQ